MLEQGLYSTRVHVDNFLFYSIHPSLTRACPQECSATMRDDTTEDDCFLGLNTNAESQCGNRASACVQLESKRLRATSSTRKSFNQENTFKSSVKSMTLYLFDLSMVFRCVRDRLPKKEWEYT